MSATNESLAATEAPGTANQAGISRGLTLFLAACTGIVAANLYYAQPLLHAIAATFGVGESQAGFIVTLTQIGYALGLAFLVPLGDLVPRRKLTFTLLMVAAVALVASATAQAIGVLVGVAALIGIGSVAAQVLVPLGASMARPERRGQVVGTIMTGLLLGILLARTVSGVLGDLFGWRVVYWLAAAVAVGLGLVMLRVLPADDRTGAATGSYPQLLRTTLSLIRNEPVLRHRMLFGALSFAAFSMLWTTIAFLLAAPPYSFNEAAIGLFGLVGVAGALSGNVAGRFVDRGMQWVTTVVFALGIALSFGLIFLGAHTLVALIAGVLVLDIGVQGMQITNQSVIYRLAPDATSRVTAAYMTSYFIGGAAGSALGGIVYESSSGWGGVSLLGAACGAGILVVHLLLSTHDQPVV